MTGITAEENFIRIKVETRYALSILIGEYKAFAIQYIRQNNFLNAVACIEQIKMLRETSENL
jgi:hypothetical protein